MDLDFKTLFGGAAIFTTIGMLWGHIRYLFGRFINVFIEAHTLNGYTPVMVLSYLQHNNFKALKFQPFAYFNHDVYVKPNKRRESVVCRDGSNGQKTVYRKGFKYLVLSAGGGGSDPRSKSDVDRVTISFLRGSFNIEDMLVAGCESYNNAKYNKINLNSCPRYSIRYYFGRGKQQFIGREGSSGQLTDSPSQAKPYYDISELYIGNKKILKWNMDELGEENLKQKSMSILAFPQYVDEFVEEIIKWKESKDWYSSKNIPWKRGYLVYGRPGTGKTALIRGLAQHLDLPIKVFDLTTMSNSEFHQYWQEAIEYAPCIMLFEDIDAVFQGRKNVTGDQGGGISFDCFLNVISGVQQVDGVLIFITTNNVDCLDDALGKPTDRTNGTFISTRPGRIDRTLELKEMDEDCRRRVANRILLDWPDRVEALVKAGGGDTGAQFQERCSQLALKLYWKKS